MSSDDPHRETQAVLDRLRQVASTSEELAELVPQLEACLVRLSELEREFHWRLEAEKLTAMQALAYGASHEINNPLANIAARAQSLLVAEKDPQRRRSLATINAQAFRAHEMIADLMLFAKPPAPQKEAVDLVKLADKIIAELADEAQAQGTELRRGGEGSAACVTADPVQIGVALRALCQNALEAVGQGGRVLVIVEQADAAARVHVSDSGPGLSDEARRHMFDPFYSGREAGRGLGLGLSKVWRIANLHGGHVLVESQAGKGTTITLELPNR
jgi:hypothetical protein